MSTMLKRIFKHGALARLARDQKGATLIEFGLSLPIMVLIVVGISDVSMGYSRKLTVEAAIFRTLERAHAREANNNFTWMQAEAAAAAGVPTSQVTVDSWLECNRARQTSFTGSCPNGSETGRYVSVNINTTYTPRFGYSPLATSNGTVPIQAGAALRIQ